MKQTCPICKTIVEVDDTNYKDGEVVEVDCPVCAEKLQFCIKKGSEISNVQEPPQTEMPDFKKGIHDITYALKHGNDYLEKGRSIVNQRGNVKEKSELEDLLSQLCSIVEDIKVARFAAIQSQKDNDAESLTKSVEKATAALQTASTILGKIENMPTTSLDGGYREIGGGSSDNGSGSRKGWIVFGSIVAVVALVCLYKFVYAPYKIDRDADRMYVFANNLNVRSSRVKEVEYNIIDEAHYGSELIVYAMDREWAYVKYNKKKGYVASEFLLDRKELEMLNGIWGNSDARETIATGRCRRALLDLYSRCSLESGATGWQFYSMGKKAKPNNVCYPRIYNANSHYTDFCFILKNNSSQEKIIAVYSFDDDTDRPIFRRAYYANNIENTLIKNVYVKSSKKVKVAPDCFVVEYADGTLQTYEK